MRTKEGLVPTSFEPPGLVKTPNFLLRKLIARDAALDYKTVMDNLDFIKVLRGGNWPTPDLTFEDDVIDLGWHQREFEMKRCFAYAVADLGDTAMLGCVYFYPPGHPFNDAPGFDEPGADVIVNMWVTKEAYERELYPKLWNFVEEWLRADWPFKAPYFSNPTKP